MTGIRFAARQIGVLCDGVRRLTEEARAHERGIMLLAIEKAGKEDRAAVRDALAGLSFESVRGPFKFDEKGDPLLVTHVVKIVDGKETNARNMAVQN